MDLLPGASLELRIYVILGLVGVMFFSAILALAIGRFMAIKSASQIDSLAGETVFGSSTKSEKPKKEKKVRASKEKKLASSVEDLIVEDAPKKEKNTRVKQDKPERHFFGKKKVDAVQMLSAPSGYEEDYAPAATRNFDSDIPEVVEYASAEDFSTGSENPSDDTLLNYLDSPGTEKSSDNSYEDLDDWNSPSEVTPEKESEENKKKNSNSPFGGADDWEF